MNYFIENFSKGLVDAGAAKKIDESYKKKALALDNVYIQDNDNVITRPGLQAFDEFSIGEGFVDFANVEGNFWTLSNTEKEFTSTEETYPTNSITTIHKNAIIKLGGALAEELPELVDVDKDVLKQYTSIMYRLVSPSIGGAVTGAFQFKWDIKYSVIASDSREYAIATLELTDMPVATADSVAITQTELNRSIGQKYILIYDSESVLYFGSIDRTLPTTLRSTFITPGQSGFGYPSDLPQAIQVHKLSTDLPAGFNKTPLGTFLNALGTRYEITESRGLETISGGIAINLYDITTEFANKFIKKDITNPAPKDLPIMVRSGGLGISATGRGEIDTLNNTLSGNADRDIIRRAIDLAEFALTIVSHNSAVDEYQIAPDIKITNKDSATNGSGRFLFSEGDKNVFAYDPSGNTSAATSLDSLVGEDSDFPEGIGFSLGSIGFSIVIQKNNIVVDGVPQFYRNITTKHPDYRTDVPLANLNITASGENFRSPNKVVSFNTSTEASTSAVYHLFLDYPNIDSDILDEYEFINFIASNGKNRLINTPLYKTGDIKPAGSKYTLSLDALVDTNSTPKGSALTVPNLVTADDRSIPLLRSATGKSVTFTGSNPDVVIGFTNLEAISYPAFAVDVSEFTATYTGRPDAALSDEEKFPSYASPSYGGRGNYIGFSKANDASDFVFLFSTRFATYVPITPTVFSAGQRLIGQEGKRISASEVDTQDFSNAIKDYYISTTETSTNLPYLNRSRIPFFGTSSPSFEPAVSDPKSFTIASKFRDSVKLTGVSAIGVRGGRPLYTLATNEKIYTLLDVNENIIFQEAEEGVGFSSNHINDSSITIGAFDKSLLALRYFNEFGGYVREIINKQSRRLFDHNIEQVISLSSLEDIVLFKPEGSQNYLWCLSLGSNRTIKGISKFDFGEVLIDRVEQLDERSVVVFSKTATYKLDFTQPLNERGTDRLTEEGIVIGNNYTQRIQSLPIALINEKGTTLRKPVSVSSAIIGIEGTANFKLRMHSDGNISESIVNAKNSQDIERSFAGQLVVESMPPNGGSEVIFEILKDDDEGAGTGFEIGTVQLLLEP